MSKIIEKMQEEVIKRSNKFEKETKGTKDEYNLYSDHIQYVYKYCVVLSENEDLDKEIVGLSALLHDISMTDRKLDRSKHNIYSAEIAERLLKDNRYPEDKILLVKKCILNHSSKRGGFRTTNEERVLVDADALSHFDSIKSIYSLAHKVMELNEEESIKYIQNKLTKDYNEISDNLKVYIQDKYEKVMSAKSINDILEIDNEI